MESKKPVSRVEKLIKEFQGLSVAEQGNFLIALGLTSNRSTEEEETFTKFFEYRITEEPLSDDKEYPFSVELVDGDFYRVKVEYDRKKMLEYFKAFYTVIEYLEVVVPQGKDIKLVSKSEIDRGEWGDFCKVFSKLIFDEGTEYQEERSIDVAGKELREHLPSKHPSWAGWFQWIDKDIAPLAESLFTSYVAYAVSQGLGNLSKEIRLLSFSDENMEVSATEYQSVTTWKPLFLGRWGSGRRPLRRDKTKDSNPPPPSFVRDVDQCFDLVSAIKQIYIDHKSDDWRAIAKSLRAYKEYSEKHGHQHIDGAIELIPIRIEDKNCPIDYYNKIVSPLAFACELAARESQYLQPDGYPFAPRTLLDKYRKAGGQRRTTPGQLIN